MKVFSISDLHLDFSLLEQGKFWDVSHQFEKLKGKSNEVIFN